MSYKVPAPFQQSGPITITYDYDPLYRLKEANYSTGDYYHYGYDAVGNRLTQDTQVGGLPTTTSYLYDDANRVQSVNGVTYTFDANGNLLNDGINTYTYDSANRLKTMNSGSVTASYTYNGMNDRLQQTVNGTTSTFTMDLNTGLTQALSDGTNNYIYGLDRIAQVNSATEYFLGDALGSVRQLTDDSGEITYASTYDPYGVTTSTVGSSQTSYGYTNEYTSNDLVYLRARMYAPGMGRFLTRDTWEGDYNRPLSLNRWMYTEANPVNLTDPTGQYPTCDCGDQGPIPDWWNKQLQIYIKGYGYIDPKHVRRGFANGGWFINEIELALKKAHQYNLRGLGLPMPIQLNRAAESNQHYWVDYAVSSNIKEEQKYGIAYGIFMDYERGYEKYQDSIILPKFPNGDLLLPQFPSGFAPADLPSDHLGFWAAMKGYKFEELPFWLQCLGTVRVYPLRLPGGPVADLTGFPENYEFLPMIQESVLWKRSRIPTSTKNIAWPASLEIQPISSRPNTWQVLNRSYP